MRECAPGKTTLFSRTVTLISCLILFFTATNLMNSYGEIIERIVAIVNNNIILLSELTEECKSATQSGEEVDKKKILNRMIDDVLLLQEAAKFGMGTGVRYEKKKDAQTVIKEFIQIRIRAFIHIPQQEIEEYYNAHRDQYQNKGFFEARDEIEDRMADERMKTRLAAYIDELRRKAYIRVQL